MNKYIYIFLKLYILVCFLYNNNVGYMCIDPCSVQLFATNMFHRNIYDQ